MDESQVNKLEEIHNIFSELDNQILNSELIQDNKLMFLFDEKIYRVRTPNQKEKVIADNERNKLYIRLVSENVTLPLEQRHKTKDQLKEILKYTNIDIDALEKEKEVILKEIRELYLELALKLSHQSNEIKFLQDKIKLSLEKLQKKAFEITTYLLPCIESRLEKEYVEFLAALCTEKVISEDNNDKWVSVWSSLEEFQNENSGLENKAVEGMVKLLINANR
jgi:hypothetical protein